jgi:hypothetical protein
MPICAFCKFEETQLHVNGVPICVNCEEKRTREAIPIQKSPHQEPPHRPEAG